MSLLIIGKGWSGTYIESLAVKELDHVFSTTRDGRDSTIEFNFLDPSDATPFKRLPLTAFMVITFPFSSIEMTNAFLNLFWTTHNVMPKIILLGSTRPFAATNDWSSSDSPLDAQSDPVRINSEEVMLKRGASVLHLAGLWDQVRDPRGWVGRIAQSKNDLSLKNSLHLIHGLDVAKAVVFGFKKFTSKKRWIVTDLRVYDWWDLVLSWGNEEQKLWVKELMMYILVFKS